MAGQRERGPVFGEGLGELSLSLMEIGQAADGGEVVGGQAPGLLELVPGGVQLAERRQRPGERHAGRRVRGMALQSLAAHPDGRRQVAAAPVLFGQLRKGNRRRVMFQPLAELVDAGILGHRHPGTDARLLGAGRSGFHVCPIVTGRTYFTVIVCDVVAFCPASSVTVKVAV